MDTIAVERLPIRPADTCKGRRVCWVDPPGAMHMVFDGRTRGWRAGSDPRQARSIPGSTFRDPHAWFVLLVLEDDWFRALYGGEKLGPGCAMWVPLEQVFTDD